LVDSVGSPQSGQPVQVDLTLQKKREKKRKGIYIYIYIIIIIIKKKQVKKTPLKTLYCFFFFLVIFPPFRKIPLKPQFFFRRKHK
jgi:hypothetical protein